MNIFSINGNPSLANPYLFNGDFIDRGSFSVEVIITLLAWKAALPKHMFLARGNHESKNLNKLYGFEGEVKKKYDVKMYDLFSELFCRLPIAHCIGRQIMVVHGGLFAKDGVKLEDIAKFPRIREPADEGIMCECLWSDPSDQDGRQPSKRGVGLQFGPDVARRFLEENGLSKYLSRFILCNRAACQKPRGQVGRLRILTWRKDSDGLQRPELLRPDGQ